MASVDTKPGVFTWESAYRLCQSDDALGLALVAGLTMLVTFVTLQSIYRIWFHPLCCFPGPWYLAVSGLPTRVRKHIKGNCARRVLDLHRRYGPSVRIGPNMISVDGSIGWPDVYARREPGKPEFAKPSSFIKTTPKSIFFAPQHVHQRQRRHVALGLSDRAFQYQEPVIRKYIDLLIDRLSERANGQSVDIVQWFNFTTFDIIGDLAFSHSFDCLEKNCYHPWIQSVLGAIRGISLLQFSVELPVVGWFVLKLLGTVSVVLTSNLQSFASNVARKRINQAADVGKERPDLVTYMLREAQDGSPGMSESEILQNAFTLILAGSETTAAALSGIFFHLSQNEECKARLMEEIRTAFKTEEEVDARAASQLPYLLACINEGLRMYPPLAGPVSRLSPGGFVDGKYVPAKTRVSIFPSATFRNPSNFIEPNTFLPQRWLPSTHELYEERFAGDNRSVFKPFSYGPRDCVGKNLAYSEMRLIISLFFLRFDLELPFDQSSWQDSQRVFVVWDRSPLYIKIRERKDSGISK
ncbi:hypothetical protein HIM_01830 [Hirsutella minnesotensis 3608]|nr:hypothetical protein HIM_01830 [Hirsutella minnesotensis 3608]